MKLKVSENIIHFWKNGHLMVDDFIRHEQYSLEPSMFPILSSFKEWIDPKEASLKLQQEGNIKFKEQEIADIIKALKEVHILVEENSEENLKLSNWKEWGLQLNIFILIQDSFIKIIT
ncbi:hypothetical protein AAAC51_46200 [Priestia megaterium]